MAWNDSSELHVADNGEVYFAPVGTALPTTPTGTLNSAFVGAGFVTEDGVTFTVNPDIAEFASWQSRQAVRRDLTKQEIQAAFALQQWNEENLPFAFGGGDVISVSGGYRYDFPQEGDSLDERALVIDTVDGSDHIRFVLPRGNVTENVESKFARSQEALLPITFKALEPTTGGPAAYVLTDKPSFAAGS